MSNQIGPLTVKLTANAEGVKAGTDQAVKEIDAGASKMEKAAEKASRGFAVKMIEGMKGVFSGAMDWGSTIGGLFEKLLGNPGRFLADNILGSLSNLANRIPVLGPLLAAPFDLAASAITSALDVFDAGKARILELGKAAAGANVDLHQFQIVQAAMGLDAGVTAVLLTKMQKALSEMALAGPEANNAVTRLGLSAAELSNMGVDKAIGVIGDRLNTLGSRYLQTAYASEIFGRGVAAAMGPLMRGSEGMDKIRKLVEGFGTGIGASDFANVRAIDMAGKQLKLFKEGFSNQITVGTAAILAELADSIPKLSELGATFKGLATTVVDAAEIMARAGGLVIEAWSKPELILKVWEAAATGFEAIMMKMVSVANRAIGEMLERSGRMFALISPGFGGGMESLGTIAKQDASGLTASTNLAFQRAMKDLRDAFAETKSGSAINGFFDRVRERLADTGKAGKDNDPFAFWLESAGRLQERLENASPVGKIKQGLAEIRSLVQGGPVEQMGRGGVVRIDPNTGMPLGGQEAHEMFAGLAEKASYALFSSLKSYMPSYTPVGAAERGSREAYSAEAAYRGAAAENIQEAMKGIQEAMLAEQKEQNKIGRDVLEAILNGNFTVGNLD